MIFEEYMGRSVYEMMELTERRHGEKTAFSWRDDRMQLQEITYSRFWADVRKLATYFQQRNLQKRYIAISTRNTYEQVVSMLAAASMGAVAVMINFDLSREDLWYALEQVSPSLIVYDQMDKEFVQDYRDKTKTDMVCCTGRDQSVRSILESDIALYRQEVPLAPDEPALVIMTSGSTAHSKLALLPQQVFLPGLAEVYEEGERSILLYPIFHIAAIIVLAGCLARGCNICLSGLKTGIMDIEWFHPGCIISVPTLVYEAVRQMEKGRPGYENVRAIHGGGAPISTETIRFLLEKNIFSASLYGCTETGLVTVAFPDAHKPGSIGTPGAWNQVRISEQGEILVKSCCTMREYIGNPEATRMALEEGWYHTGDMGYLDQEGFLFITGRLHNIILFSNGENVSPEAIEAKLGRCSVIDEVLVYGENERIKAKVWCGTGATGKNREQVQAFVDDYNRTVPLHQQVREVVFSQEPLEKTGTGKIKR